MRTLLNIVWVVLAGLWLAIEYLFAGVLLCLTTPARPGEADDEGERESSAG
jgi:uncharacterized membrane protein YccF (DUF307 family)